MSKTIKSKIDLPGDIYDLVTSYLTQDSESNKLFVLLESPWEGYSDSKDLAKLAKQLEKWAKKLEENGQ